MNKKILSVHSKSALPKLNYNVAVVNKLEDDFRLFIGKLQDAPEAAYTLLAQMLQDDESVGCDGVGVYLSSYIYELLKLNISLNSNQTDINVILTSTSARRKDLLSKALPAQQLSIIDPGNQIEYDIKSVRPEIAVMNIALQKIISFAFTNKLTLNQNSIIIASDTFINLGNGERVGKINQESVPLGDQIEKLQSQMGKEIKATTGLVMYKIQDGAIHINNACSTVRFRPLDCPMSAEERQLLTSLVEDKEYKYLKPLLLKEIVTVQDITEAYCVEGKHKNKAGGFGIQDRELFLCIENIHGDPCTVVGLPVSIINSRFIDSFITMRSVSEIISSYWPEEIERTKIVY
ncbi:MAG TPA: hypothetical protein DF296_02510 [Candidatus Margulisbacteria bacterium]|nr:MAG: hypothetical protein A2X42_00420 [Candidatus Margulisbacteria bacterium GWF2_38_17]OGI06150.1 MAG: hypothetical protein A2X41_10545 [Candidatus Margulisbacteria bacterium GWE2_39_32]HCT84052.1 hypothetical protein [Candidatus Margulisiibacteriota bacterium]